MPRPLFRHDASRAHNPDPHPPHPERVERIVAAEAEIARRGGCGFTVHDAPAATDEQLLRVHPAHHLEAVRGLAAAGGGAIDGDTSVTPGSWEAAVRAAGGAVAVVDALLAGGADRAAAVHRPPGHHCETDRAMGFCLLNGVAVAAAHAVAAHGLERVLVLDWDVHHGNGTAEIFDARSDVLFVSLHQWPLYPGTGAADERGTGAGLGATLNLPVPPGAGDEDWLALLDHVVLPEARRWAPQLVLVSAGFDAHEEDPLAQCRVTDAGFRAMAAAVHGLGAQLGAPVGLVLEGGYDLGVLARCLADVLEVLAGEPVVPTPAAPTPLAARAALALASAPSGRATSPSRRRSSP